mmetsp:Transcript_27931/g.39313  ORF Transcript_27931/g.39313 Transcript_27931/m.39313 type:complete len:566 (-) Transcript_27931:151-1848(-)
MSIITSKAENEIPSAQPAKVSIVQTTAEVAVTASSKPAVPAAALAVPIPAPAVQVNQVQQAQVTAAAPAPTQVQRVAAAPAPVPVPASAVTRPVPAKPVVALSSTTPAAPPLPVTTTSAVPVAHPPKSKSKKKKSGPPTVTMATAPNATSSGPGGQGENTGRWTAEEHRLFLQGLEQHGKGWKKIASLIKSRTVVQIRTHAQKYFQKLAKARQNGEEGEVSMEGRGGTTSVATGVVTNGAQTNKRRRQTTGTKRKAISSVVSSAQRQGKKIAAAQAAAGVTNPKPPLPAVAPALAPYVVPNPTPPQPQPSTVIPTIAPITNMPSISTANGTISGQALEDSLFRFLTPAPVASVADPMNPGVQVNDVARQAGANPITVPQENPSNVGSVVGGEVSPVGVADAPIYPSWTDVKELPNWYAKGSDVDALLDVGDSLDWLVDSGDLHETYQPPPATTAASTNPPTITPHPEVETADEPGLDHVTSVPSLDTLQQGGDSNIPPLPSLFDGSEEPLIKKEKLMSSSELSAAHADAIDEHLNVFDTPMDEHAFVSALLENNGESSGSLPVLS